MKANANNLVLEMLRETETSLTRIHLDVVDLKCRMTAVLTTMHEIASRLTAQCGKLDRIDQRLSRIELRLDRATA
jgi:hypothetical protein